MQATLARLYAHILRFLQQAMLWYRQGKLMHTVSAIVRPWVITYKEQLEAVTEASMCLDKLSDMATKAELRDTRLEVIEARKDWLDAKSELKVLQDDNRRLADLIQNGIGRLDQTIMCRYQTAAASGQGLILGSLAQGSAIRLQATGRYPVFNAT